MINIMLLTGALIQIPADSEQHKDISVNSLQKTTLSTLTAKTISTSKHVIMFDATNQELSMEIKADLEAEFERMVAAIDEELTQNIDTTTAINLYSQKSKSMKKSIKQ
jgi:type II secretory pathway component PulL